MDAKLLKEQDSHASSMDWPAPENGQGSIDTVQVAAIGLKDGLKITPLEKKAWV